MDELDMHLRELAHREQTVLPPGCGELLEQLEGEIRRGEDRRPRRKFGRRAVLLAAVLGLLACGVCAAAAGRMEWLAPVVDYGDSGALMETYSVEVGQTAGGNHCDLTLETAITDGEVIYCLFTGRYDEEFLDVDTALEDTLLMVGNWANAVSCWRLDQGEEPGQFRFIASTGQITDSQITENRDDAGESFLGREVALRVQILDDAASGVMQPVETYAFTVRMNDTIPSREAAWPDGTRVKVTPLMLRVSFRAELPDFTQASGGGDPWMAFVEDQDLTLRFADGSFTPKEALPLRIQRGVYTVGGSSAENPEDPENGFCEVWMLFPELADPGEVMGLELRGNWYEFPET